jgi:propanol-preferring alcohol dehydrogenase
MQAMVLEKAAAVEQSPLKARDWPRPEPGAGEIRIRVKACGLCHTDLHTVEGELPLPKLPLIPGHQIVGVVEARGRGANRFREGERVGVPWLHSTCGGCDYCRQGRENLCDSARFTGYHADGGYAEFTVVSQDFAYPLPAAYSDVAAAPLLCAGVIGYRALRLSEIRPGERLGLYGFGGSAHIAIQVARHWGCEVYVFTRSEEHRELARQLGAAWAGRAEDEPPAQIHSAVIFAPAGSLVPEALRVLRKGGVVALAGIYMSPLPSLPYASLYHERNIRSVSNSTRQDVREFLQLAGEIPVRTEIETFPLLEANQALVKLKHSALRGAGVLTISADNQ